MSKLDVVEELHRSARKNFGRRKTQMRGIADTLQADLVEMIPYARQNQNYKYILTSINIFSKMAYARPLKNKTGIEVARALRSIFNSMGYQIKNLHVDMGKEFYNAPVKNLLEEYGLNLYSTYTTKKAAICERFNRTLKGRMWKQFSLNGNYKWIGILDDLIENYNNSYHRTIKMSPINVNSRNEQRLLNNVYNYEYHLNFKDKAKFKEGDPVRLSKYKNIFEKSYTPNWTTEIFRIRKVQRNTYPVTYLLKDYQDRNIKGTVYAEELQLVKYPDLYLVEKILRRRGNQVYVKWLGFDNTHNQWINENDVL